MSCPGLHCPGCSEGQSLGIAAAAVAGLWLLDQTAQVVAEYIWEIGATVAACFALAVAASMWLEARTGRRAAAFAERRGIASRADVDELTPAGVAWLLRRERVAEVPRAERAAIENHYHVHYHAADGLAHPLDEDAARVGPGRPGPVRGLGHADGH